MSLKPVGWLGQEADRHDHCYPIHKTIEASPDVLAEGFKVVRVGDTVGPHGGTCEKHPTPHGGKVQRGSASVFANGKPLARQGDTVECDTGQTAPLLQGRAKVLVGDASPVAGAKKKSVKESSAPPPDEEPLLGGEAGESRLGARDGDLLATAGPKSALQKAIDTLDRLRASHQLSPLDQEQRSAIQRLDPGQAQQFVNTVQNLTDLDVRKITSFEYVMRGAESAARIAERERPFDRGDLWDPIGLRFLDLMSISFSQPNNPTRAPETFVRLMLNGGSQPVGAAVEETAAAIMGQKAGAGFTLSVTDSKDKDSTVQHHLNEFLQTGAMSGVTVARAAQDRIDPWGVNPGDVLNGYFAAELGFATARSGVDHLTPTDAVRLLRWSYGANQGAPWPSQKTPNPPQAGLLPRMVEGYNKAHPGTPIRFQ